MSRTYQNGFFVVGVVLGAALLAWSLPPQTIGPVLLGSAWGISWLIAAIAIAIWFMTLPKPPAPSDDLLSAFESHVSQLAAPAHSQQWQASVQLARSAYSAAIAIATADSYYTGDVVTALHSILALLERLALGLQAEAKVETLAYRAMVHQHIETSQQRLRDTCLQLQTLRDQLTVAGLNAGTISTTNLSAAISANQAALNEQFPQA